MQFRINVRLVGRPNSSEHWQYMWHSKPVADEVHHSATILLGPALQRKWCRTWMTSWRPLRNAKRYWAVFEKTDEQGQSDFRAAVPGGVMKVTDKTRRALANPWELTKALQEVQKLVIWSERLKVDETSSFCGLVANWSQGVVPATSPAG